jgi:hypothetical protein
VTCALIEVEVVVPIIIMELIEVAMVMAVVVADEDDEDDEEACARAPCGGATVWVALVESVIGMPFGAETAGSLMAESPDGGVTGMADTGRAERAPIKTAAVETSRTKRSIVKRFKIESEWTVQM